MEVVDENDQVDDLVESTRGFFFSKFYSGQEFSSGNPIWFSMKRETDVMQAEVLEVPRFFHVFSRPGAEVVESHEFRSDLRLCDWEQLCPSRKEHQGVQHEICVLHPGSDKHFVSKKMAKKMAKMQFLSKQLTQSPIPCLFCGIPALPAFRRKE